MQQQRDPFETYVWRDCFSAQNSATALHFTQWKLKFVQSSGRQYMILPALLLPTPQILFSTTLPWCHYSREPHLLPWFPLSTSGTLSPQDLCSGYCLCLECSALSHLLGYSPNFSNLTLMRLTLTTLFNTATWQQPTSLPFKILNPLTLLCFFFCSIIFITF